MKNLYLDTNIYLTFYHFSNDDLIQLRKLIALVNTDNIKLLLTEQTKNEFDRNRDVKISDALKKIKEIKIDNKFPIICQSYEEYPLMRQAITQFEQNKSKLIEKLQIDAEAKTLQADEILTELFQKATIIETNPQILNKAILRYDIGNPPGKDRSYGDAINWESLLDFGVMEDLYFISDDQDFYSKLNDKKFNDYLLKEWQKTKNSKLFYYKKISDFFKVHFPDIEISSETEKDIIIKNLFEASNFYKSKKAISKLMLFENFSIKQLDDITTAFSTNNQIYWIKDDLEISNARKNIIEINKDKITPLIYKQYEEIYKKDM